jgi:predicted dehydrogenase
MDDPIRWGIAATGRIAAQFATGIAALDDGVVAAVASRSAERAAAFAATHGIARSHGSLAGLAADPGVDVVYVASPHAGHEADTLVCLDAGKPVLCEKPLALSAAQGGRMVARARDRGLFLMEAIWSRFLPAYVELRRLLEAGAVGPPRLVEADFGFRAPVDRAHRLFAPELGGGALLDLGIYPLQLASLVLGPPARVTAVGHLGETGVDELVAVACDHPGGAVAVAKAAIRVPLPCTARISGEDGWIGLPAFMHTPLHLDVGGPDGAVERIECPYDGVGLRFEAAEVHRCLRAGLTESPVMPLDESLTLAATLDAARAAIGLRYPGEPGG